MFCLHQAHRQAFGRASEQPVNHIADGVTDDLIAADPTRTCPQRYISPVISVCDGSQNTDTY